MNLTRRSFFAVFLGLVAPSSVLGHAGGHRHPHGRGWRGGFWRGRRWRIRRRPGWRVVGGRRLLVVPLAIEPGWELEVDEELMVVEEVREETILVRGADGKIREIEVLREDTDENSEEFEGSEIFEDSK